MTTPDVIKNLVERFEANRESYRSGKYNETQLRREFLDPFFEALGWDIFNKGGYAETYKDVIHEDSLEIEGENKAPDYAFRIGGARKFFVEAKKPAVNIEFNIHPAFQLRRYAWSAKLPLGILTDFEEFAVYDCRTKPDKKDKASLGRIALYSYKDYIEKWDEIAAIFSRDAVLKGSFDQYAEGLNASRRRGTTEVDDAFLAEIERWRDLLAKNIALRNPSLNVRELNYAVQITIDRIIFLRICEDRGVERDYQLKEIAMTPSALASRGTSPKSDRSSSDLGEAGRGSVYAGLCALFKKADARYNSGLFHFKDEKEQSGAADNLTLSLIVDDKVLQDILKNLYYPESPYVFREIPSDILGQVYERFLGKVIRLTAGHQAKVEEKPEVRKAGGVYYTPTYIVEYIVQNTVGKLLEGKTPKEAARLKILDPACGSGTFPLGAYQYLLDWHLKYYAEADNSPEKWLTGKNPAIYQVKDGYRLTTAKKKEILLNNIFGVDIDAQAVEVTKLSLLLKVLEGESSETIGSQLALFQERVLPDLGNNIKCGNSLIGPDYYEGQQLTMGFEGEEERYRVNAFDWRGEFSDVFIHGGFDAVIGNPPYIRIQELQETSPIDVEFYKKCYQAASKGNYDIYVVFIEKGLSILNERGRLGFILPHKFFNAQYGAPVRNVIAKGKHLAKVVHFGDQQVFESATTYTCLMFLDKAGHDEFEFEKVQNLGDWRVAQTSDVSETSEVLTGKINASRVTESEWNFIVGEKAGIFEKLLTMPVKLGDVADRMAQGIRTSANEIYVVNFVSEIGDIVTAFSKQLDQNVEVEKKILSPFLQGREIKRYQVLPSGKMVVIPYNLKNGKAVFNSSEYMQKDFPKTLEYLSQNKTYLENREKGKMRGAQWYAYVYPKNIELMKQEKILVPDIADRAQFAYDENGEYAFTSGYGITIKSETKLSPKYILGLLNSKLLEFYLKRISTPMRGGFFRFFTQFLEKLPIPPVNFTDPVEKAMHDKLVSLVERMLALHKQSPRSPQEQEMVKREIESTDKAIDKLVYELYGLTDDEIAIVANKS
ncbi:MAG: Eco57I restriction-modification methylase domain-containing protein [Chloroflexi bacterium]|nr:Eco57I restriction-modification methylase domain-containing protein [Chloroflexota bacterium]